MSDVMSFLNKMTVSTIDATISPARIRDKTRIRMREEASSGVSANVKSITDSEIKVILLKLLL